MNKSDTYLNDFLLEHIPPEGVTDLDSASVYLLKILEQNNIPLVMNNDDIHTGLLDANIIDITLMNIIFTQQQSINNLQLKLQELENSVDQINFDRGC